ncbi:Protein SCO1 [Dirofilaria immitis]
MTKMLPLVTIVCIFPAISIFMFAVLIINCSSKRTEPKVSGQGVGRKDGPAALQEYKISTPRPTPAAISPNPIVPAEKKPNEKEVNKEKASKKEGDNGGAAVVGGEKEEEDGGYESCPDMTPEQLAKIANESPTK